MFNKKEYNIKYCQEHKEKHRQDSRQYYRDNREKVIKRVREYQQDNQEYKDCKNLYYQDHKDMIKKYQQTLQRRYAKYREDAKRRNLLFELTLEQFKDLTENRCSYCNQYSKDKDYVGIDRILNDVGYNLGNSIPCCDICNQMKTNRTLREFLKQCRLISNEVVNQAI